MKLCPMYYACHEDEDCPDILEFKYRRKKIDLYNDLLNVELECHRSFGISTRTDRVPPRTKMKIYGTA